jgi:hypothetical protein
MRCRQILLVEGDERVLLDELLHFADHVDEVVGGSLSPGGNRRGRPRPLATYFAIPEALVAV